MILYNLFTYAHCGRTKFVMLSPCKGYKDVGYNDFDDNNIYACYV